MAYEFKTTRRMEFADTDMAGIVHFARFFPMMEATEHAFFRSLGFSIHSQEEDGFLGWPRVHARCDYMRPIRFEEEIEIQLLVGEVRNRSIRYDFVFRKLCDGAEVARGSLTAVCARVDRTTGKLEAMTIPETIRAKIQQAPPEVLAKRPFTVIS